MQNEEIGLLKSYWSFLPGLKLVFVICKMIKPILLWLPYRCVGRIKQIIMNVNVVFLNYKMLSCNMHFTSCGFFKHYKMLFNLEVFNADPVSSSIKLPGLLSCLEGGERVVGKSSQKEEATASNRLQWLVDASWWARLLAEVRTRFHETLWK